MGLIKTACLATLGLETKLREIVGELVRKGEANDSSCARSLRSFLEKADEVERDLRREEAQLMERVCKKLNVPTRADIDRLHRKLDDLAASLAASQAEKRH